MDSKVGPSSSVSCFRRHRMQFAPLRTRFGHIIRRAWLMAAKLIGLVDRRSEPRNLRRTASCGLGVEDFRNRLMPNNLGPFTRRFAYLYLETPVIIGGQEMPDLRGVKCVQLACYSPVSTGPSATTFNRTNPKRFAACPLTMDL